MTISTHLILRQQRKKYLQKLSSLLIEDKAFQDAGLLDDLVRQGDILDLVQLSHMVEDHKEVTQGLGLVDLHHTVATVPHRVATLVHQARLEVVTEDQLDPQVLLVADTGQDQLAPLVVVMDLDRLDLQVPLAVDTDLGHLALDSQQVPPGAVLLLSSSNSSKWEAWAVWEACSSSNNNRCHC